MKKIFVAYCWRLLQFFCKSSIPLFISFYSARILFPEQYGDIVYFLTIFSLINIFSNFGFSTAVLKEVAELDALGRKEKIKDVFPSISVISLLITFVVVVALFLYKGVFNYLLLGIPYLLFCPLTGILDGIYVGSKKFKKLAFGTIIVTLISLPVIYYIIPIYKELGVIISYSIFYTLLLVSYYIFLPFKFGKRDKQLAIKILKYSFYVGFGSISFFLYTRVDILILGEFKFTSEIGIYELIMRLFEVLNIPILLLGQILAPYFISFKVKKNFIKIFNLSHYLSLIIFLGGLLLSVLLYNVIPIVIEHYYPLYNTSSFNIIMIILLSTIPLKFVGVFMTNAILTPLGFVKIVTYSTVVFGLINVILDIILINYMGFVGVFYSTLFVHNLNIIIQYLIFNRKFRKNYVQIVD